MTPATRPRVIGAVQARLGSTRLPRKSLADIGGRPMAIRVADRLAQSGRVDAIAIATTVDPVDDALVHAAAAVGLHASRGPVDDLVRRLYLVSEELDADYLVRAWGDCPLLASDAVASAVDLCVGESLAYVSNCVFGNRTYPPGIDLEVYSRDALRYLEQTATDPKAREFPAEFVIANVNHLPMKALQMNPDLSQLHLTVDYEEDLEAVRAIYRELEARLLSPTMADLIRLFADRPELAEGFAHAPRNVEYQQFIEAVRRPQ